MNNNDESNNKESNMKKILNDFKAAEEKRQRLQDLNDKKRRKFQEFLSNNTKELEEKTNDLNMAKESVDKSRSESKGISMQTYNTLASYYMEMSPSFESLLRLAIAGRDILVLQGIRFSASEEKQWFFWDNFTSQNKQFDITDLQFLINLNEDGHIVQSCIAECLEGPGAKEVLKKVNDDFFVTFKAWIESVDGLGENHPGYFVGLDEESTSNTPQYKIFSKSLGKNEDGVWSLDELKVTFYDASDDLVDNNDKSSPKKIYSEGEVLDQESFQRLRDGESNPDNSLGDFLSKKYHDVMCSVAPRLK